MPKRKDIKKILIIGFAALGLLGFLGLWGIGKKIGVLGKLIAKKSVPSNSNYNQVASSCDSIQKQDSDVYTVGCGGIF